MPIILFWAVIIKLSLRELHEVFNDYTKFVGSLLVKICPQVFSLWTFDISRKYHCFKEKPLCVTFLEFHLQW